MRGDHALITLHQLAWLKEFLLTRSETDTEKENALEIVETFRALWEVVRAGSRYRDTRSNDSLAAFCESLEALKKPKGEPNMKRTFTVLVLLICAGITLHASEIQWTRMKGTVKASNAKTQMLTLQNQEGDLFSIHIDGDIDVVAGKDTIGKLSDLKLGDKVTLLYNPKAAAPKDADQPVDGVYKPIPR